MVHVSYVRTYTCPRINTIRLLLWSASSGTQAHAEAALLALLQTTHPNTYVLVSWKSMYTCTYLRRLCRLSDQTPRLGGSQPRVTTSLILSISALLSHCLSLCVFLCLSLSVSLSAGASSLTRPPLPPPPATAAAVAGAAAAAPERRWSCARCRCRPWPSLAPPAGRPACRAAQPGAA
jgi:hypothetical protein